VQDVETLQNANTFYSSSDYSLSSVSISFIFVQVHLGLHLNSFFLSRGMNIAQRQVAYSCLNCLCLSGFIGFVSAIARRPQGRRKVGTRVSRHSTCVSRVFLREARNLRAIFGTAASFRFPSAFGASSKVLLLFLGGLSCSRDTAQGNITGGIECQQQDIRAFDDAAPFEQNADPTERSGERTESKGEVEDPNRELLTFHRAFFLRAESAESQEECGKQRGII